MQLYSALFYPVSDPLFFCSSLTKFPLLANLSFLSIVNSQLSTELDDMGTAGNNDQSLTICIIAKNKQSLTHKYVLKNVFTP